MKKMRTLIAGLLLGWPLILPAQEFYDITPYYLQNAGFDAAVDYDAAATGNAVNDVKDVAGWVKNHSTAYLAVVATFQYGTAKTFYDKSVPATGPDGSSEGACLSLCAAFGSQLQYYQAVELPAGSYQLVTTYYNCNAEAEGGESRMGWLPTGGEAQLSPVSTFAAGQWTSDTIRFTLAEKTKGQIQIGFKATVGMVNASAMLAVDCVKLLRDTPYGDGDITGDVPTVKTDKRFARGATMAFGRMTATVADGTITERGFCWAETPEPTIADHTTTTTLTNNGTIYWLQDLKPATKYYMRAYAKTSGRQVGYGDVIKFYTLPKGQITFTMRSGDAAPTARIKAAAETAVNWWNNLTEMKGFSPNIGYNAGTPTAECSYGGWMSVGSNTSYQKPGTIMHEMLHGCGVIPWANTEWSRHNLRSGVNGDGYGTGLWLGDRVTEVLRFWDNSATSQLNGDYQHMWPYGINGASEDNGSDVLYIGNGLICQALGEDGLQHTSSSFAEPYYAFNQEDTIKYYIKNESEERGLYTSYLVPTAAGTLMWRAMPAADALGNDSTAWYITFTPSNQYYQLRNAATGQYLTYANGIRTASRSSLTSNENFHFMKGRVDVGTGSEAKRGYWIIHPTSNWTPPCLQANSNGLTASVTFDIANAASNQRWLILTADETTAWEQASIVALKQSVADVLAPIKALASVPHTENANGVDDTFSQSLADIEQRMDVAASVAELLPLTGEAQSAAFEYLCNVTATDMTQPFDLTYMVQNAGMDATDGWTGSPSLNYSCAEFYQTTFDFNQTIAHLPAGTYQLCAQGFQRPGSSADAYNGFVAGTSLVTAYLYAGGKSEKLAHIATEAQDSKLGGSEASVGSGKYLPNNMQAASIYFAKGLYANRVVTQVADNGSSMKIGLRSSSMPSNYWCIFDNFRLYFYGGVSEDAVLGVETVAVKQNTQSQQYFDLQGRRVATPAKGLYIQNGRKVVVQ